MNAHDMRLEQIINAAAHRCCDAIKQTDQRRRFKRLCALIKRRSPEAVRALEEQKGLVRA